MPLISCKNLSVAYDKTIAVSKLNFEVNEGDYLCIVGENGSGKSTLIKTILSLKTPLKGKIKFGEGLLKNEIGYLPQQTSAQKDFPASVWEVVLSGCLNQRGILPFYSKKQKEIAKANIKKLGLANLVNRSYKELSGGQQQRVLLARALCATKKLLLLDEPVAGLDPTITAELYQLIKQLNAEGITIIMVSHDIQSALKYATHILHLHKEQLFFGESKDYAQTELAKMFLGGCSHD